MESEYVPTEYDKKLVIRTLFFQCNHDVGATVDEIAADSTFSVEEEREVLDSMYLDGLVEMVDDCRYRLTSVGLALGRNYEQIMARGRCTQGDDVQKRDLSVPIDDGGMNFE